MAFYPKILGGGEDTQPLQDSKKKVELCALRANGDVTSIICSSLVLELELVLALELELAIVLELELALEL